MTIDHHDCRRAVFALVFAASATAQMSCSWVKQCEIRPALSSALRMEDIESMDSKALEKLRMNLTCPL